MAYWNADEGKIVGTTAVHLQGTDWWNIDCGCCGGIQWNAGTEPIPCSDCGGSGSLYLHAPSGMLVQYPGGPAAGRMSKAAVAKELKQELE